MIEHHLRVEHREGATLACFLDNKIHAELAITTLGEELQNLATRPDCTKLVPKFL